MLQAWISLENCARAGQTLTIFSPQKSWMCVMEFLSLPRNLHILVNFRQNLSSPQTRPEKSEDWPSPQNLQKNTPKNQQKTHKSSIKIWLENCICKALRWVLVSEKFDRRAGKLNFTYRKPLPGSNGGTESAEGKKTTPQTPEAIRIQGETQEPRRHLWWCWSVEQLFSYSSLLTSVQRSQTCALSPERDEQTLWGQLRMFCN